MEITSRYEPKEIEDKWYAYWLKMGFFRSLPDDREPYCIVIPPPNVTGVLHMGHMLNNTIQDVLVRRAKMQGKNTCWVPGTDHASIATEAKVVAKLKEAGINKIDITRDEFIKHAWEWKEKHGNIILEQLKKLGASCDWERTKFTMDADMSESVIRVFIDMYKKGIIYRGVRMINWDPKALTALSDEEVIHKEVHSKLYYIRYRIEESNDEWLTIATTRPETILGDTAICVHPDDARYKTLKGKYALVPLINRSIPVIYDAYVDREFGTGALKVTPAHDINDYMLGAKHKLSSIDIFNDNGTLNEKAELFIGENRFVVRKKIVKELDNKGHLVKIEDIINKIGYSERTDEVIEPKLSTQWFMKMPEIAKPALDVVINEKVKFYPDKFINTYKHWLENVKDWCISRQLWWGHRIPAYYLPDGEIIVAPSPEAALEIAKKHNSTVTMNDLRQDDDVLDTWFSSWLWPIAVFDGIRNPDNPNIKYYYPTNDLITAPEILFFWVARMIMAGLEYRKDIPFRNVYLTGIVRDKLGRKMSKSLGNSPEPIMLMEKYGADGVRIGMLLASPAGNDLLFDECLCEQGRNFSNKIWNAFRLIKGWQIDESLVQPQTNKNALDWIQIRIGGDIAQTNDLFNKYRISDALMMLYKLVWDDFCAWYLEMIKPAYQQPIDKQTYEATLTVFEKLLKLLHPFMPFITEEIWHLLQHREEKDCIMLAEYPKECPYSDEIIHQFALAKDAIIGIRKIRKEKDIPFKEAITLYVKKNFNEAPDPTFDDAVCKLCNVCQINYVTEKPNDTITFVIKNTEFYIMTNKEINTDEELKKMNEELKYLHGFLQTIKKKLENKSFVENAPAQVIEVEKKKQADTEAKIKVIEQQKIMNNK